MQLSLRTSTTADLVAGVLDGSLDGAFVAGPIEHADLTSTVAFREELVLVTARHIKNLPSCARRRRSPARRRWCSAPAAPTASAWSRCSTEFGWPSATRFELGTLDGMVGCVAAGMGITLLPRAVVERNDSVSIHGLSTAQSRVETLFITRRAAHEYSALRGFMSCLSKQ